MKMKNLRILSIGNSFSQDAQHYLHEIAKGHGLSLKCVNLMIGGCSLRTHYLNMLGDLKKYNLEFNGQPTGFQTTLAEALSSDDWDAVTLQQVSQSAVDYDTFQPYLSALADCVRRYCPRSKLLIHQTWAYEQGSDRLIRELGYANNAQMFSDIEKTYNRAAQAIVCDGTLPSGRAMKAACDAGMPNVYRDTFHAGLGAGRYLLSLTWFTALTKITVENDTFDAFDVPVTERERALAIASAMKATEKNGPIFA